MDGALEWAVVDKKPVSEIDFTLHTMEDGTLVSTQETV
jgi:serine/threonine-protein phosphatase 2B catalytic subunit